MITLISEPIPLIILISDMWYFCEAYPAFIDSGGCGLFGLRLSQVGVWID